MKKQRKEQNGITLIALVITIIILLILAGISISSLTQGSLFQKAGNAKIEYTHSMVKEAVSLEYADYQMELNTSKEEKTSNFFEFLQNKQYIDSDGIINVANLLGNKVSLGNGTGLKDVYKIEENYVVNYYENNDIKTEIWSSKEPRNVKLKFKIYDHHEPIELANFSVEVPFGWTYKDLVESDIYENKIKPKGVIASLEAEDYYEYKYYLNGEEIDEETYNSYCYKYYLDGKEITRDEYYEYYGYNEYDGRLEEIVNYNYKYYLDGEEITEVEYYEYLEAEYDERLERKRYVDGLGTFWSGEVNTGIEDCVVWRWASWNGGGPSESFKQNAMIQEGDCISFDVNPAECVFPNTHINTNLVGATKQAKDICKGDNIVYYNTNTDKNEIGKVKEVYEHKKATEFVKYVLEDGSYIESTDYHPIFTSDGWKSLTQRNGYDIPQIGDQIKTIKGWKKLIKKQTWQGQEDCYDFVVINNKGEIINNYYANGILVQGSY